MRLYIKSVAVATKLVRIGFVLGAFVLGCGGPSTAVTGGAGGSGGKTATATSSSTGTGGVPTFDVDGGGACLRGCETAGADFDVFFTEDLLSLCGCHDGPCAGACDPTGCDEPESITTGDACSTCLLGELETWSPCAVRAAAMCANGDELAGLCNPFALCVFDCATVPVGVECGTEETVDGGTIPSCASGLACQGAGGCDATTGACMGGVCGAGGGA